MNRLNLWDLVKYLKDRCTWVDLTHELSPDTPRWSGWPPLQKKVMADLESSLFSAHLYSTVGQYGTHVDAPTHMVKNGRSLDKIDVKEMILPLCVIDKTDAVKLNVDYSLTRKDIEDWEQIHGKIPAGSFVIFQSGWSRRTATSMDNLDSDGNRHFPGWSLEALKFLVKERNISGIGHETSDTEAPVLSCKSNYEVEYYILAEDKLHVELLTNVELCPPTGALFVCTFPKVKGGTGFPARCFAIIPE